MSRRITPISAIADRCATFGPSSPRPNCRGPHVGPHNRCSPPRPTHPSAPPPRFRRCAGDGACPILLRDGYPSRYCPWHADLVWALPQEQRNAELAAINAVMRSRPLAHNPRVIGQVKHP